MKSSSRDTPLGHTPGPWYFDDHANRIYAPEWRLVLDLIPRSRDFSEAERDANARLIAAAPDLYDFAHTVVQLFEAYPRCGLHLDMDKAQLLDHARAAIKKARGE